MKLPDYEAGRIVRFDGSLSVTIGTITTLALHPAGTQYDGPAVIVNAYITNGRPVISMVSLSDPLGLVITKCAARHAKEAPND